MQQVSGGTFNSTERVSARFAEECATCRGPQGLAQQCKATLWVTRCSHTPIPRPQGDVPLGGDPTPHARVGPAWATSSCTVSRTPMGELTVALLPALLQVLTCKHDR